MTPIIMFALIGTLVLLLLTMVSYAGGITLAAQRREYPVAIVDLAAIAGLWLVIFRVRPQLEHLLLLAFTIALGVASGFVVGAVRLARQDVANILPTSELPEHARDRVETAVAANFFKCAWYRWNDFAARMGNVQGRLLMGFFYFFIVTPFGLVARLFTDTLAIKKPPPQSNWRPKEIADLTVEAAKEQG